MRPFPEVLTMVIFSPLVLNVLLLSSPAVAAPQPAERFMPPRPTVLTQLPQDAFPAAINNRGDIVGSRFLPGSGTELFYWSSGTGYIGFLASSTAQVADVNERGQVVGSIQADGRSSTGFLWSVRDGLTLLEGMSAARAINNHGEVVGDCRTTDDAGISAVQPCVSAGGTLQHLPVPTVPSPRYGGGFAFDINDGGDIVGTVGGNTVGGQAALWTKGVLTLLERGTADSLVVAMAISNRGIIAGYHYGEYVPSQALLWDTSGRIIATVHSDSLMYDINDRGLAVGYAVMPDVDSGEMVQLGLVLLADGRSIALPGLGGRHAVAVAINARGDIVGSATDGTHRYPVLWEFRAAPKQPTTVKRAGR